MSTTTSGTLTIESTVFPFRFRVDAELRISDVGASLARMSGEFRDGRLLTDVVNISRPRVPPDFDELRQRVDTLLFLTLRDRDVTLRGQFVESDDSLLFLGSPWFESLEQLAENNLRIHDIAPHDATLENIFIRVAQSSQLADLKAVLRELESAAEDRERLARAEQSLASDLSAAGDLLIRLSTEGTIRTVRAARPEHFPVSTEDAVGCPFEELVSEATDAWESIVYRLQHGTRVVPYAFSLANGATFESRVTSTLNDEILLLARDVSEQQSLQRQLEHQASHDPLTDLPNRKLFEERVAAALQTGGQVAILFIDLDDFKTVNDHHGHQAGDRLLIHVASNLKNAIRPGDTAARLGGDEFGVLLPDISESCDAEEMGRRILESMKHSTDDRHPAALPHQYLFAKASIGVATSRTSPNAETLFRDADIAMYRAKESHDQKVVVFECDMYTRLKQRLELRQELEFGLERGEIVNDYQPVVRLLDDSICGMEALVRWRHPERGLLSPDQFIDIAEESGSIRELGRQVLYRACRDVTEYCERAGHEISVNVNVSASQVQAKDFAATVRDALESTGLRPNLLTLEITESVLFEDFNHAARVFDEIKALGVQVALDDFGAGHSSLKYLKQFPVDTLKLDRSVVADTGGATLPLIRAVIDMGRALNMKIVAEGIETRSQRNLFKSFGCHWAQGFYFSQPLPISELIERYSEHGKRSGSLQNRAAEKAELLKLVNATAEQRARAATNDPPTSRTAPAGKDADCRDAAETTPADDLPVR